MCIRLYAAVRMTCLSIIRQFVRARPGEAIDAVAWASGAYRPTPTIIEAAQALYGGHTVSEISRSDAGIKNLTLTTQFLDDVVAEVGTRWA
jgi:hypothetical protein